MARSEDIRGRRFGKLIAVEPNHDKPRKRWLCKCDCGGETITDSNKLLSGYTQSCRCKGGDFLRNNPTALRHGMYGTPEYNAWASMVRRIISPTKKEKKNYGDRGIDIDPNLLGVGGFENFYKELGPKPSRNHSVDRKNNNRGYWLGNLRWATSLEQSLNKRNTRFVEFNGQRVKLHDICRELDLPYPIIINRLSRGWSDDRALNTPVVSKTH